MNNIKNSLLIISLTYFLFANQTVFNWESMTSLINSNSITQDSNGYIIGATSGGIIKLDDESVFEDEKGEAETLAGFVLEISKSFPKINSKIAFKSYLFTVEALNNKRIKQLKVTLKK